MVGRNREFEDGAAPSEKAAGAKLSAGVVLALGIRFESSSSSSLLSWCKAENELQLLALVLFPTSAIPRIPVVLVDRYVLCCTLLMTGVRSEEGIAAAALAKLLVPILLPTAEALPAVVLVPKICPI